MLETEAGSEEVTWRAWPPDREKYTIYAWYVIESAFLKKQLKFSHMDFYFVHEKDVFNTDSISWWCIDFINVNDDAVRLMMMH